MEKFMIFKVGVYNKIVSATNVVLVEAGGDSATATTTLITYQGGKVVTLTHAAQVAQDMVAYIQTGILDALQTSWTKPGYVMPDSPRAISDIDVA